MSNHVEVRGSAERELGRLSNQNRQRIAVALLALVEQPLPPGVIKLKGSDGYRIRIGDYRVLYTFDPKKKGDFGFRNWSQTRRLPLKTS